MITAGVLLAAGTSHRFGPQNKLLARLDDKPLVAHAAAAMRCADFDIVLAVVADCDVATELDGFHLVWVDRETPSLSQSLRAGIAKAHSLGVDRALVSLGDMPGVTPQLLSAVAASCTGDTPTATINAKQVMVPACFPRSMFATLMALEGDEGANALIRHLPCKALIRAEAIQLRDIDTPEDLKGAKKLSLTVATAIERR